MGQDCKVEADQERHMSLRTAHRVRGERAAAISAICQTNSACADCGEADPEWVSINHGSLICIECSGVHRSLGTHISKVRSITLDAIDVPILQVCAISTLDSPFLSRIIGCSFVILLAFSSSFKLWAMSDSTKCTKPAFQKEWSNQLLSPQGQQLCFCLRFV